MANILLLKPIILKWEGGYVCDPLDRGGATNKGVTLSTFQYYYGKNKTRKDLEFITDSQWLNILLKGYWAPFKASKITNQSLANICVDFAWASGTRNAIVRVQRCLGLVADGVVGEKTLEALNSNPKDCFNKIKEMRLRYVNSIVDNNKSQARFINGWVNRINYFKFEE